MTTPELHVARPLSLKCGLELPNRLVKAAMAESLADESALPGKTLYSSYERWADGGWGMILTGNVQIDRRHLGQPKDVAYNDQIPYETLLGAWKTWAKACMREGTPTIVQINHPGRQSPAGAGTRGFFEKSLAPSPIPMNFGDGLIARAISAFVFGTPKEMTDEDIHQVVSRFVDTARLSSEAGFSGVELHAAHGYLLAQFLSHKTNKRTDKYGESAAARAKIVVDIIHAIRAAVPKDFCVGIKLNSVDHQSPSEFSDCLEQIKLIAAAGVDFIEVSGGSYEKPDMVNGAEEKSARTTEREAFFLEFANAVRHEIPSTPLMVTGGFRTRKGMDDAIAGGACELVGIGRPAALNPELPKNTILNPEVTGADAKVYARRIHPSWFVKWIGAKAIGAGAETAWYGKQIHQLAGI
ncbi:hypothetical protein G7Z17_g2540 [Cylindrodendrum hubeiense]|uniref:NADH:flavin oxidoreductase/NADH oxidase N-terminal domain-containing protein n=1 Tax=Cylindrodendrum hubeiense TaxID=595255 RepID=A0A9P5HKL2_9HYPO|nr:hypothetical protein G7Z17_g2540 [Cylindrodendrum hubeiense]